jgi:aminoglycoside 6'-N-acetyltransferase
MRSIEFVDAAAGHLAMVRSWMEQPHWRDWWGDPATEIGNVIGMIEGRDTTRPFIFFVDGEAAGYIQYWFIGPHQTAEWTAENPWLLDLPADAVGVDLSIGPSHMLGHGIGSAVLRKFVAKLRTHGHSTIIIDPDPANLRAVRAYEKAGFTPIPELLGRTGNALIMQHSE